MVLLTSLFTTACGPSSSRGPVDLQLTNGYVAVDERTLRFVVPGACVYQLDFSVEETPEEVRIRTTGRDGSHCPGDDVGADSVGLVHLEAPLESRRVIDLNCLECPPLRLEG